MRLPFIGPDRLIRRRSAPGAVWAILLALGAAWLAPTARSDAAIIDLTAGAGSSGTLNGAIFEFDNSRVGAGTGSLGAFVRMQAVGAEQGYNSSSRPVRFDEKTDLASNHDVKVADLPIVYRDQVPYYEFILDAHEAEGGGNEFLSLDRVRIYTSSAGLAGGDNPIDPDLLGVLRYDMDAGDAGNHVRLDTSLSSGSGQVDMTLLVPVSSFDGAPDGHYVYLYSMFGEQGTVAGKKFGSGATFEEWALLLGPEGWSTPVPEPATAGMMALGAAALVALRLRPALRRRAA